MAYEKEKAFTSKRNSKIASLRKIETDVEKKPTDCPRQFHYY